MGIINRYVLRQILVPSGLAILVVAVLGVANEIQEKLSRLPVAQMTLGDAGRLALFFLPALMHYLVPITYMLGILWAFGRFAHNNEMIAMKAAGIPMKRIVIPVVFVGAFLSVACFFIQDRVQPWAISRVFRLICTELPLRATLDALPAGVTQEFAGWRVHIGKKDPENLALQDIVILKPEEGGRASTYYARSARILKENNVSTLEMTGVHFIPAGEGGRVTPLTSDSFRLPLPKIPELRHEPSRREFTVSQLYSQQLDLEKVFNETHSEPVKKDLRKVRREIAERFALPFACLAVCLAAAPLGVRAQRSGRSYTFAMGFAILLIYYVLHMTTEIKTVAPLSLVILVGWLPNALFCIAGLVLIWRVDRV